MDFLDKDNKALLWGILQENNAFNGLSNDKFSDIQKQFENIILHVNSQNNKNGLLEKNKICIALSINMINKEKEKEKEKEKPPKIQMIYKSEELQNERQNIMNKEYNNIKQELNTVLNPNKPQEINFKDNSDDNIDKPIGDEMDKLIAERMSTRERELEIPEILENAKQWVNNGRDELNITTSNEIPQNHHKEEKKVTFKDSNKTDNFDIFSKLKKIPESIHEKTNDIRGLLTELSSKTKQIKILFTEIEEITEKIRDVK
jgi:hypothetical protein